jgi:hypothetical protein
VLTLGIETHLGGLLWVSGRCVGLGEVSHFFGFLGLDCILFINSTAPMFIMLLSIIFLQLLLLSDYRVLNLRMSTVLSTNLSFVLRVIVRYACW